MIGGAYRAGPCVLCYHTVTSGWDDELAVRPAAFEAQIRSMLGAGFAPAAVEESLSGSRKVFHVTFDDAFRKIGSALDLLESLGVPATVFVCTDLAGDGRALTVGELGGARAAPSGEGDTMTWDELRDRADRGVEIGSHTCSHPHLTRLSDGELRRELRDSRERVADELRRPCRYLAYPFGEHDDRVRAASRAAGYTAAFSQLGARTSDLFAIPRVSIYGRDSLRRMSLKRSSLGRVAAALRG